jgi:hypothetical protein
VIANLCNGLAIDAGDQRTAAKVWKGGCSPLQFVAPPAISPATLMHPPNAPLFAPMVKKKELAADSEGLRFSKLIPF